MKITRLKEVHIIVNLDFSFTHPRLWDLLAKRAVQQIERHIDDVANAHIEQTTEAICSHCGLTWEEEPDGLPVCCSKAQEEWVPEEWISMNPAPQARKDKDGQPEPLPAVSVPNACKHDFQYGKGWDYIPGACKVCVKCGMPENSLPDESYCGAYD